MSEELEEKIESNYHYQSRLSKLESIRESGIDPFPSQTLRSIKSEEIQSKYAALANGEATQDILHVAGRIMSIRNDGMFIDIYDDHGKTQIYTDIKNIDEQMKDLLRNLDLGDFISVEGNIRRTPRGELTINSKIIKILTKTLLPLPEKYHGVHDTELRYRQRYIDILSNQQSKQNLLKRFQIISTIRSILTKHDFLEVETPMLHSIAGGAIAKPFVTHHNALGTDLYLRIAPELYLKQLIISNISEKIFEINRCFRNEGISTRHNPEFTSLELYQAYADYQDMMDISEMIISHVCQEINQSSSIAFGEKTLEFSTPWQRKSMTELIKEKTSIDFMDTHDASEAMSAAKKLGLTFKGDENWGQIVERVFAEKVEDFLIQPIHVTDLPTDISPLSKAHAHDKRICERFETYINGWEISNGFSELNDPLEQENRFLAQTKARNEGDEEAHHMDEDFITALKHGMPPTGGLGIGLDRLAMLMTNSHSIREIIAFPTLKPKSQ